MDSLLGVVRRRRLSSAHYALVTGLSVWALAFIIVTGGAVRLTGSGLGCPDWPTCASNRVVAPWQYHAWIEFGNRLVTGVVSLAVVLAVLGALLRAPRRRDLTWLSVGLVVGVLAQIVLGGETVEHHLEPQFVMSHFLLSMLILCDAVVLHHRARVADEPDPRRPGRATVAGPAERLVPVELVVMARLLLLAALLVVVLGTIVTSTGPHGGDPRAARFPFSLHQVAQLHGSSVELFGAFTLVTLWTMIRSGAPAAVLRSGEIMLVVLVAQAGVGYLQYFTGVPVALVEVHIAGAAAVVVTTVRFNLCLYHRPVRLAPTRAQATDSSVVLVAG